MFRRRLSKFERDVRKFHKKFGVPVRDYPFPNITAEEAELRARLTMEEAEEVRESFQSLGPVDICQVAQENVDLIYVCIGNLSTIGLTLEGIWDEVHRANMRKVACPDGGKIRKPEGWRPPRMARHIINQDNRRHDVGIVWRLLFICLLSLGLIWILSSSIY